MMPGDPVSPSDPIKPGSPVGWDPGRPSFAVRWLPTIGIAAGILVVLAVAGFQAGIIGPGRSPAPSSLLDSPVVGVVVAVDSAGLGQVRDFVIRVADGTTVTLALGPLENATEFPPGHLVEHLASSEPVRAFYRLVNGSPTAYRLEDATAQPLGTGAETGPVTG